MSYEHWGVGIAPLFSIPKPQNREIDAESGVRFFYRKNMNQYSIELGAEALSYRQEQLRDLSFFVLGQYRFGYMDLWDISVGVGGGGKERTGAESLLFFRGRVLLERDFVKNQTFSFSIDWDKPEGDGSRREEEFIFSLGYTYYFGIYAF